MLTQADGTPVRSAREADGEEVYDEFVIGQETQVVPIYLVEFDPSKLGRLAAKFEREVVEAKEAIGDR